MSVVSSIDSPLAALREDIEACVRAGSVAAVKGPAGVGKTSMIEGIARKNGWDFHVEIGSLSEPTDIAGFPVVEPQGYQLADGSRVPALAFAPRVWMRKIMDRAEAGIKTLILLDELTCVTPAVRAVLLRLVQTGQIGDVFFPRDAVAFVVAYNPAGEAVNGSDLEFPMINRLDHFDFPMTPATVKEWCSEFPGYWGQQPKVGFGGDGAELKPEYLIRARSFVAGYLNSMPDMWHYTMSGKGGKKGKKAAEEDATQVASEFPQAGACTPRSWDRVATHLAFTLQAGLEPFAAVRRIEGAIGSGAAMQFQGYMREADLPDPHALLADPESYTPRGRMDVDFAVLMSVATVALGGDASGQVDPDQFLAAYQIATWAHAGANGKAKATEAAYAAVRHLAAPLTDDDAAKSTKFVNDLCKRYEAKHGAGKRNDYNVKLSRYTKPFLDMMTKIRRGG